MHNEVAVPFAVRGRRRKRDALIRLSQAAAERLIALMFDGLKAATTQQQAHLLTEHRPPRRTGRGVVKLRLSDKATEVWHERKDDLQKATNRRIADRLPVAALALAISQIFGTIPSDALDRGFLSFNDLKTAVQSIEHDVGVANEAMRASNEARVITMVQPPSEKQPREVFLVKANRIPPEDVPREFNVDAPVRETRELTPEEAKQRYDRLRDKIKGYIRELNAT
ncbi:MAG: hypothetical protein AB7G35_07320 [Hyphomicrobiaceae bacterium]